MFEKEPFAAGRTISNTFLCLGALGLVLLVLYRQPAEQPGPARWYAPVRPLHDLSEFATASPGRQIHTRAPAKPAALQRPLEVDLLATSSGGNAALARPSALAEHASQRPMAVLNRERARQAGALGAAFKVYQPRVVTQRPGGDLDEPATLARAVAASAAESEVMLLCVGGAGSMRTGMNLVYNFRAMGLYNMLILALEKQVCERLWDALPQLACVWWPSKLSNPRPKSLYNTMFSKVALAFFEARKLLLEHLVLRHSLNVLHLDADTVWFANPYPIFKTIYAEYSLIVQTDNPFVNAGIMYVQNVQPGDASAWVLQELNRRIDRFTYRPESVRTLPNSAWSTPPHFANADEQANLNDIVASALNRRDTCS